MPYPHKLDEDRILEEATRLVDERGLDGLSTRVLATRLGARAPSLYRYFPDKECLVRAVGARLLGQLADELRAHETLVAMARAYWAHALRYPRRYEVISHHPPDIEPFLGVATRLAPAQPLATAHAIWSYLHGAATLRLAAPAASGLDADEAFELGLRALERGLIGQTAIASAPSASRLGERHS
jgi:AcrR family transcriptional regulator